MTSSIAQQPAKDTPLRRKLVQSLQGGKLVLPMLPDTASRVIDTCNDESCDARELAGLIERDVSLAGHVLRISNSTAYAPNEPIVSLQQAVSRLGFSAMCGIAVGVAIQGQMFQVKGHEKRLRTVWRHSAAAGGWAKEIARIRRKNVEGAFLCGLLHDIGRPIVLQAVVDLAKQAQVELEEEELVALMDEFHAEVGSRILESWKMPEWMATAVKFHHDPTAAGNFADDATMTGFADVMSHWSTETDCEDDSSIRGFGQLESLGLYADELDVLFEKTEIVNELAEAFL